MRFAFSIVVVAGFHVAVVVVVGAGCGGPPPIPLATPGTCDVDTTTLKKGEVDGTVCGNITAGGDLVIAEGKTLTITKGSVLVMPDASTIEIDGTLAITGEKGAPVTVTTATNWNGIVVAGTFNAAGAVINGHDGGIFESRGSITLTDVSIDEGHALLSPDCITTVGGTLTIDHAHVQGCHCPMHIAASDGLTVTNTILDGAADPIMISDAHAEVHHSHLLAADAPLYDLGGGIDADVGGNYYGGGAPHVGGEGGSAQFTGLDDFSSDAFNDVGPRF